MCATAVSAVLAPLAISTALATDFPGVQPAALDQPRINAYLTLTPGGPPQEFEGTFNISAFFDTGASGILLSNNTADFLGLERTTHDGQTVIFSDVGVAGTDDFHVSPQVHFGLAKYHPDADVDNPDTYTTVYNQVFGPVRTQIGPVNVAEPNPLLEDLDVLGVPLMQGKVVVMDPRPVNTFFDTMRTYVYNPGTPFNQAQQNTEPGIPVTDRHVRLSYGNFERFTTTSPSGAPAPTLRDNPFVGPNPVLQLDPNAPPDNTPGIKSCYLGACTTGSWLLDTGAAASIISLSQAGNLNVSYDPANPMGSEDPKLLNVPEEDQFQLTIGGIGGTTKIAGFFMDSMLMRTMEGNVANDNDPNHIRFLRAPVLVADITVKDPQTNQSLTLDGILGMNFFVASAFITEAEPFPEISNLTYGNFDWVTFDQPGGTLGLKISPPRPQGQLEWLGDFFGDNEWDIATTANWRGGNSSALYEDGDHVNFGDFTIGSEIRIAEPVAPGSITFDNSADVTYSFRGQEIRGFTGIIKRGEGRVIFENSNSFTGTINVEEGRIEFSASQDIGDVNVHPGASVSFSARQHLGVLRVVDSLVESFPSARNNILVTEGLEVSGTGTVDLYDNGMIIAVAPGDLDAMVAQVNALIKKGLREGVGLLASGTSGNTRLGVISNAGGSGPIYETFAGESGLSGAEVLVLHTLIGDLNLDSRVTIADFIDLAAHFNGPGTWQDGDINYDGMVTIADFIDLAGNFNTTYSGDVMPLDPLHAQMLADFEAAHVPEPAVLLTFLPLAVHFCTSRRRRMTSATGPSPAARAR
jgi:autotransporter-associated beta strand protein